jgi:hypothetical protein
MALSTVTDGGGMKREWYEFIHYISNIFMDNIKGLVCIYVSCGVRDKIKE